MRTESREACMGSWSRSSCSVRSLSSAHAWTKAGCPANQGRLHLVGRRACRLAAHQRLFLSFRDASRGRAGLRQRALCRLLVRARKALRRGEEGRPLHAAVCAAAVQRHPNGSSAYRNGAHVGAARASVPARACSANWYGLVHGRTCRPTPWRVLSKRSDETYHPWRFHPLCARR